MSRNFSRFGNRAVAAAREELGLQVTLGQTEVPQLEHAAAAAGR